MCAVVAWERSNGGLGSCRKGKKRKRKRKRKRKLLEGEG